MEMKKLKMMLSSTGAKLRNLGKVIVNGTTVVIGGDYIRYKSSIEGLSKSLMEEKVIEGNFSNIEIKAGL